MKTKERIVLCRHVESAIGEEPVRHCSKPIKKLNRMNWCEKHLSKLPYWPA